MIARYATTLDEDALQCLGCNRRGQIAARVIFAIPIDRTQSWLSATLLLALRKFEGLPEKEKTKQKEHQTKTMKVALEMPTFSITSKVKSCKFQ